MADFTPNSYNVISSVSRTRRFSLYQAESIENGRQVLIKTPDSLRIKDAELAAALLKEAETHLQLKHPGIRAGYEAREDGGVAFFIGEFIEGESLAKYLTRNDSTVDPERNLVWIKELLDALTTAHKQDILHLGLNPYNIIVDSTGHLRIIGFGKPKNSWLNGEEGFGVYHPILYVASELFQAGITLPASDQYSWAVIAYQLFCGVVPWRVDLKLTPEQQKQQSLCRAVIMPEVLKKEMPDWLFAVLLQCLKLDPNQRFGSIDELLHQIEQNTQVPSIVETEPAEPEEPSREVIEQEEPEEPSPEVIEPEPAIEPTQEKAPPEQFDDSLVSLLQEPESHEYDVVTSQEPDYLFVDEQPEELPVLQPVFSPEPICEAKDEPLSSIEEAETLPKAEPESIPETKSSEAQMFQPVEMAETLSNEPAPVPSLETEQKILPDTQSQTIAPPQTKFTSAKTYQTPKPGPGQKSGESEPDTSSLKKTFRYLFWASAVILVFIAVKYIAFSPHPKPAAQNDSLEVNLAETAAPEENHPLQMIKVPGDTLVMGSIDPGADDDEFPLLTVFVPSLLISKTEITQQQWLMVFPDNPSFNQDKMFPVENVSFYDAIEFCNAKSLKDGLTPCYDYFDTEVICNFDADGYRLPTEAEWEFAAKSGKRRDFFTFSGSENPDEVGWHNANSDAKSHQVAGKKPNQLGIFDLSGNLYEWVWNWYSPYSYKVNDQFKGPANGTDKALRGGSWYHPSNDMRVCNRSFAKPFQKTPYIGFRVVRKADT